MQFSQFLPILKWIKGYDSSLFKADLIAGLTVGVMLIPQGMAYALLAGMPPIYGLYTAMIPLIVYALLGTSRQLAVGPVAMVALLIAASVENLAVPGTEEYIAYALALALMVGIIQLAMAVMRLGFLVNFLSHPVIAGFTSAAAIIIMFSQLKNLLGVSLPRSSYIPTILGGLVDNFNEIHLLSFLVGGAGIVLLFILKKTKSKLPGPLVIVVLGISLSYLFNLETEGMAVVGEIPKGLPKIIKPLLREGVFWKLLPYAITIAFIGYMESIAVGKAIQKKHKNYRIDPNQELIALGAANVIGSFFQSFPIAGGFGRTAVNDQSGAKTQFAAIISALVIGLTLLFFTGLFVYLPTPALASIIIVAVFGLVEIKEAKLLWKEHRSDFWMFVIAFLGTIFFGIEEGIVIGAAMSLVVIIFRTTRPHFAVLGRIPGTTYYRNIRRFKNLEQRPEIMIYRFDARLYFANIQFFRSSIEKLIKRYGEDLKLIIINAESINDVDSSALMELESLYSELATKKIAFHFSNVKGPVRDIFHRTGFTKKLGAAAFHLTTDKAVAAFDKGLSDTHSDIVLQTDEL